MQGFIHFRKRFLLLSALQIVTPHSPRQYGTFPFVVFQFLSFPPLYFFLFDFTSLFREFSQFHIFISTSLSFFLPFCVFFFFPSFFPSFFLSSNFIDFRFFFFFFSFIFILYSFISLLFTNSFFLSSFLSFFFLSSFILYSSDFFSFLSSFSLFSYFKISSN